MTNTDHNDYNEEQDRDWFTERDEYEFWVEEQERKRAEEEARR